MTDKVSKNNKKIAEDGFNECPHGFNVGDIVCEIEEKISVVFRSSLILKARILEILDKVEPTMFLIEVIENRDEFFNGKTAYYSKIGCLEHYTEKKEEAKSPADKFKYNTTISNGVSVDHDLIRGGKGNVVVDEVEEVKEIDYDNLESMKELNALIGLRGVKKQVEEIIANIRIENMRKKFDLKTDKQSLHMIFKGSSGTGKTTVARIIGKIMSEIGALKSVKGKETPFIEIIHTDVTGKFVGDAEKAVAKKFEEARGGVLFLDEVYSFAGADMGTGNDEVKGNMVTTMVKLMEELKDEVIVIGAGYSKEVDRFIAANTGLSSRFPNKIIFEDYSVEENVQIAEYFCGDKDYVMTPEYIEALKVAIGKEMTKDNFGNARTVRNIIEKSIRTQSNRILKMEDKSDITKEILMTLTVDDLEVIEEVKKEKKTIGFLA